VADPTSETTEAHSELRDRTSGLPRNDQRPRRRPFGRMARGTTRVEIPLVADPLGRDGDGMWQRESCAVRWGRRAITIPGLFLITALYAALLPLLLVYSAAADAVHRRPLLLCRFHLVMWSILFMHCVGLAALAPWWLIGRALRLRRDDWRHFHRALESWWAAKTLGIACLFYGTRYVAEDAHVIAPGPVVLLSRHASTLDTILPLRMLGRGPLRMILRIVQKRELLWDPCVDVMAHRLPRTFVRRGSGQVGNEIERLERLCEGMGSHDVVLIFPEGTRFTPAKQAEVLAKLAVKAPDAAVLAARLKNVLPPRPLGTLALLEARTDMDVVFCAHTGLEDANRIDDLVNGSLLGKTVRVKFWRVPRSDVPYGREERTAWLHAWWERVDQWIEANRVEPRRVSRR
jgi:1-acyl-sn-glycerol-3-phosphate acyltransferase